jgi:hypothetical protein
VIVAALVLLAIGGADLLRRSVLPRRRWIGYLAAGVALVVLAAAVDAGGAAVIALLAAAGWVAVVRLDGSSSAGLWAAALLALLCAVAVVAGGAREDAGPLSGLWSPTAPWGSVHPDVVLTALGCALFLLESGNVVVRSALRREMSVSAEAPGLKGGRLIGPLERLLVFALTLAGAYTLLAAVLAAKGIVRFPEISRDGENGSRAEYFLIGSLVSWVTALAAALLVWWGVGA